MSRVATWTLAIYVLTVTGFAAYEYAYIQHLEFLIRTLLLGTPN